MWKSSFESQILKFWKFSRIQSSKKVRFSCAKLVQKDFEHPSRLHEYIKLTLEMCLDTLNVVFECVELIMELFKKNAEMDTLATFWREKQY